MKTRIHVNKQVINYNNRHGECREPITVKTYKSNTRTHCARILTKDGVEVAKVVHAPACNLNPLSCGAVVWIETDLDVVCE